jgi:hypothetical protein
MNKMLIALTALIIISCNSNSQNKDYAVKALLPKQLKEISGIVSAGNEIFAISDKPHPVFFKLSDKGDLLQEITLKNATVSDVEAITADDKYVYIGDVGDNEGDRQTRSIIKVLKANIGSGPNVEVSGEVINFIFSDEVMTDKKKLNDYDCESLLSYNDSLYLFTKRRTDDRSELFVLPKTSGTHVARSVAIFETHGLITDAAINSSNNEVALTGYEKGHTSPFIIFFKNFKSNNFFSGTAERIELGNKKTGWQIEGVTYKGDNMVYFSCEETKDVPATLYGNNRDKLPRLKTGK